MADSETVQTTRQMLDEWRKKLGLDHGASALEKPPVRCGIAKQMNDEIYAQYRDSLTGYASSMTTSAYPGIWRRR